MSSKVNKLLRRLRQSKTGWRVKDLKTLYEHYGFIIRSGAKHDVITHPDFPQIRDMLPRGSGELAPEYAKDALKSIEKVLAMFEENVNVDEEQEDESDTDE